MNQKQDNIRTMFDTTAAFLDDNNSVWSATPAFANAVTRVKIVVQDLDSAGDQQQTPTTGVTEDKAQARSNLEEKTLEIADQLSALAAANSDILLASKVEMTKSSLDQASDNDLEQVAERVFNLANDHAAALTDYGVTAADISDLTSLRTACADVKTAPRGAAVGRKTMTESLPEKIARARSIFRNELDKMVTRFKRTNPDFYTGYATARVIVNRAATQKKTTPATPPVPVNP
jgi:hypothetical protein